MAYDRTKDFVALLRQDGADFKAGRMPAMDLVVREIANAGLIALHVGDTAPTANQDVTAWLDPANPSYGANGQLLMWDGSAYVLASMTLFARMLRIAGEYATVTVHGGTGLPLNSIGKDGDWYIREDEPGGIHGPKAVGVWPTDPVPGSRNQLYVDAGEPNAGHGFDGDWYVRSDGDGGLWYRENGAWKAVTGTRHSTRSGIGSPDNSMGNDGDMYARRDAGGGLFVKVNGAWLVIPGTQSGDGIHIGSGAPSSALGADGDLYFRNDAPGGAYYKTAGAWTLLPGLSQATETVMGIAEISTQSEVDAGADDVRFVTAKKLRNLGVNSNTAKGIAAALGLARKVYSVAHNGNTNAPSAGDVPNPVDGDAAIVHDTANNVYAVYARVGGAWTGMTEAGGGGGGGGKYGVLKYFQGSLDQLPRVQVENFTAGDRVVIFSHDAQTNATVTCQMGAVGGGWVTVGSMSFSSSQHRSLQVLVRYTEGDGKAYTFRGLEDQIITAENTFQWDGRCQGTGVAPMFIGSINSYEML